MSIYPSTCGGVPSWYGTAGPSSPAQTWLYRGLWSAGTAYAAGDLVVVCTEGGTPSNGTIYQATTTHCGDESAQPGSGPDWRQFWRVYAEPGTPTPLPPLCPDDGVTLPPDEGLAEHAAGTTDVHGIPDTSELVTRSEMEQAIAAALANLPPAEGDWETPEGAQAKADAVLAEAVAAASLDAETRDQEVLQRAQAAAEEARTAAVTAAAADADQKGELILQQAQEAAEEARTAAVAAGEEAAREAEQNAAATAATHAEAQDALVLQQAQEAALAAQEAAESAAADNATQKAQAALQEALTASEACCEESRAYARTLLEQHEQERHTPMTFTDGIVAEEGWEVDAQKLVVVDNELTAIVRLSRTGPDLVTLEDPQEGNLVPDILIARCSEEWCPPDTVYIIGATGYGHGSLRIHATGEVYLLDWSDNNPLKTDHDLRWTYTVLKETLSGS